MHKKVTHQERVVRMDENFRYVSTSLISKNDCKVKAKNNNILRKIQMNGESAESRM